MLPPLLDKLQLTLRWAPTAWLQGWMRPARTSPCHLIFALADHFEPAIIPDRHGELAPLAQQEERLERWCREYPRALDAWRDHDGFPLRHTYFYPAEQYHRGILDRLADHCRQGWGEVEIHLHHGLLTPDTAENTRRQLAEFRDMLAMRHGCLSRWRGAGGPRYAFVHGNWALANSNRGRFCGVNEEMQILAETGCYADFTLPAAPSPAQVRKINAVYECALPLRGRAPHRRGRDLRCGHPPQVFPLVVQGPLAAVRSRRSFGLPRIENAEIAGNNPPTPERFQRWRRAAIGVQGRPDWIFIKLHCHGMDPRDEPAMLGDSLRSFLNWLVAHVHATGDLLYFTTAREMTNMLLAACDGRDGNPGQYRDYRLQIPAVARRP